MKKIQPTEAELRNDPSLRWAHPYRQWEALEADGIGLVRFAGIEGGKVRLATLNGLAPLPDLVEPLSVRRPSARSG